LCAGAQRAAWLSAEKINGHLGVRCFDTRAALGKKSRPAPRMLAGSLGKIFVDASFEQRRERSLGETFHRYLTSGPQNFSAAG
jgi:hypothetical protein